MLELLSKRLDESTVVGISEEFPIVETSREFTIVETSEELSFILVLRLEGNWLESVLLLRICSKLQTKQMSTLHITKSLPKEKRLEFGFEQTLCIHISNVSW